MLGLHRVKHIEKCGACSALNISALRIGEFLLQNYNFTVHSNRRNNCIVCLVRCDLLR